jgi:hypothetical protein
MDKQEAARIAKALENGTMSVADAYAEFPKVGMVIDYIVKHYPDDKDAISNHRMLPSLIFSEYSNSEIESMIDKLAIFNDWKKYEVKS